MRKAPRERGPSKKLIPALDAGGAKIQGMVSLVDSFSAGGGVVFAGATIGGDLVCTDAGFSRKVGLQKSALTARSAKIQGSALLRQFRAEGGVNLGGATIDGSLECDGSEFIGEGEDEWALNANCAKILGNVNLRRNFKARGGVNLALVNIGGNVALENGANFVNKSTDGKEDRPAINAGGAQIEGEVMVRRTQRAESLPVVVKGTVRFTHARVRGGFLWRDIKSPDECILDLRFTNQDAI